MAHLTTLERMPMPVLRNLDYRFGMLVTGLSVGLLVAYVAGVDPRGLSAALGSAALGGILYRLITTWTTTPVLVHVLAIGVCWLLLWSAVGQYQLLDKAPLTAATWPGVVGRLALIVVAIHWPAWVDRKGSPFRKQAAPRR